MRSDRAKPVAFGTDLHCTAIVDASWSYDGTLLAVCSTDGYMTLVRFEEGELGGVPDWSGFAVAKVEEPVVVSQVIQPSSTVGTGSDPSLQKRRITPVIVNTKE